MGTPEIGDIYIHTPIESPMVASLFEARNDKYMYHAGLQIRLRIGKLFSLFLMQNICCGYSKEPSQWDGSFEHPKHMFKLLDKKIIKLLRK